MSRSQSSHAKSDEASRLKRLRQRLQFSQRELALEFKVTSGAVALWETGARAIPGPVLRLMELYEGELDRDGDTVSGRETVTFPTTRVGRSLALSVAANHVAVELLGLTFLRMISSESRYSRIRAESHARVARKLAIRLGKMKGLVTKSFQLLNCFDFLLTPEAKLEFSRYERLISPMSRKTVAGIITRELGGTPRHVFQQWSATPLVTASIGQVHRAVIPGGEKVAVKIQYPKIAEAIRADLQNVAALEKFSSFFLKGQDKRILFEEMASRFQEECSYLKEAENQEHFRKLYSGRPEFVIPHIHHKYSTDRVLVSDYVKARSFRDFNRSATQEQRDFAGKQIWQFAYDSILRHGVFNADPHPGNYLFAERQVVFLDFGCIATFDASFLSRFRRWLLTLLRDDKAGHDAMLIELGIAPRPELYDFAHHFETAKLVYRPMLSKDECAFSAEDLTRAWRAYFVESPNRAHFNHSKEWVFQLRLNWGLTYVLASLGSRVRWRKMLESLVEDTSRNSG